jgi:hypothetical protein
VILDDLTRRGMGVYSFAGFFGQDSDAPTAPAEQEEYVRYTLARLAPYSNVLLNVAGPEPTLHLSKDEVDRLGGLISGLDVFKHPLSVHNKLGNDKFIDESWESYVTLQGPKTTDLSDLSEGLLRNHANKPLLAQETVWSGNKNHPEYSDKQLRQNAYVTLMSAAALNFADNDPDLTDGADGKSSDGFSGSMDLSQRLQHRHDIIKAVWDFFETIDFHELRPRQDLVSKGFALANAGDSYLVYLPAGGSVDVSVASGSYQVQWINAANTTDRRAGGLTSTGHHLVAPNTNDWLVHLTKDDGESPPPDPTPSPTPDPDPTPSPSPSPTPEPSPSPPDPENLAEDPGFENDGDGWSNLSHGEIVNAPVRAGDRALELVGAKRSIRNVHQDITEHRLRGRGLVIVVFEQRRSVAGVGVAHKEEGHLDGDRGVESNGNHGVGRANETSPVALHRSAGAPDSVIGKGVGWRRARLVRRALSSARPVTLTIIRAGSCEPLGLALLHRAGWRGCPF